MLAAAVTDCATGDHRRCSGEVRVGHPFRQRGARDRREDPQAVGKLKRFKRIALRCEKTARHYGSFVALACAFILIKSAHSA